MKRINRKAFSKIECMTIITLIAILLFLGVKVVLDNTKNYGSFKTVANKFANAVARYRNKTTQQKNEYSLYELEENGYIEILKNPLDSEECDKYESFVSINGTKKEVTLVCGENIVEGTQGESYKIYEVSRWSEKEKKEYNDGDFLYNYKEDGKVILGEYVPRKTFLMIFEKRTGKKITDTQSVKSYGKELMNKIVYREKKLIKEIK